MTLERPQIDDPAPQRALRAVDLIEPDPEHLHPFWD